MLTVNNMLQSTYLMLCFYKMVLAIDMNNHGATVVADLTDHPNWNLLPHDICGQRAFKETLQIPTSGSAYFGQFPWMVFLFDNNEMRKKNNPKCGGTIISNKYVLTTTHCCRHLNTGKSRVRIGEFDIVNNGPECTSQGCVDPVKNLRIEEVLRFPETSSTVHEDHVCLIRLKNKINFNVYVQPNCLPIYENFTQLLHEGDELQFSGLRKHDSKLAYVSWPLISDIDCNNFYPRTQSEKFCLGSKNVAEDLDKKGCYGNAGHAVMESVLVEGKIKTYVLGLYARFDLLHYFVCDMKLPKIFTKVSEYSRWILDSIKP